MTARLTRRTVAFALAIVAATFALIFWIVPIANELYRQVIYVAITGHDEPLRQFPNWSAAPPPRLWSYQFQQHLALGFGALPFALLGLGLTTLAITRRRPWLIGTVAAALYIFAAFPLGLWISAQLLRASSVPPFVLAWGSNALAFGAGALLLARRGVPRSETATPANP